MYLRWMRHLILATLFVFGCSNESHPIADMAAPADLTAVRDLYGLEPTDGGGSCLTVMPAGYHPYVAIELFGHTASDALVQQISSVWASIGISTGSAIPPAGFGCQVDVPFTGPNSMSLEESGGSITVSGGTRVITFEPDANDDYAFYDKDALWPGNAQLGIDIGGACDVPAKHFDILMPKSVVLMTPAANAVVSRNSDLTVTWTPGSGRLGLSLSDASGGVSCAFDASTGSGTIPTAMLAKLKLGAASLGMGLSSQLFTSENGRTYRVSTTADVLLPNGAAFTNRSITLQ
jgi:hypothetical protein